ncbi:MAG: hypothetical protein IKE89_02825 [Bacilli bacterium]|nr:hypothetical protein [Bacilli bacterium]
MQEQKPKRKISFLFTIIMCIIVGVAEFFILKGGYLGYSIVKNNDKSAKTEEKDDSNKPKEEDTLEYLNEDDLINSIESNGRNKYSYVDIDNDGYDELLTYIMVDDTNFDLTLYKGYDKGLVFQSKILEKADGNINFIIKERDNDYIALVYAYEGVEKITRVYYENGKLKRRIVANHKVDYFEYQSMVDTLEWTVK